MTEEKSEEKRLVQLGPNRMKVAEYARTWWGINAEPGTKREDLLKNEYWAHVALQFKPLDRLEVRADDGLFFAEYLVIACERTWCKVKELTWIELSEVKETAGMKGYRAKFMGPQHKWGVIRESDDMVITKGLSTKDEAYVYIADRKRNE